MQTTKTLFLGRTCQTVCFLTLRNIIEKTIVSNRTKFCQSLYVHIQNLILFLILCQNILYQKLGQLLLLFFLFFNSFIHLFSSKIVETAIKQSSISFSFCFKSTVQANVGPKRKNSTDYFALGFGLWSSPLLCFIHHSVVIIFRLC